MMRNRRQRRGAILPLTAVLMIVLIALVAFVFDFSQAYAQKNQLQTASDAAAHAGVIELVLNPAGVEDAARDYASRNTVLGRLLPPGNLDWACGIWDEDTRTFMGTTKDCTAAHNAVTTTTYDTLQWLWPWWLDGGVKEIGALATAWLGYVGGTKCVKPWGMDYTKLTTTLDPGGDPNRVLTDDDLFKLQTWPAEDLQFQLTLGQPDDPGNFGPLNLSGTQGGGSSSYEQNIWNCNSRLIGEGDILYTEPGNPAQATYDAVWGHPNYPNCGGSNCYPGLCPPENRVGDQCIPGVMVIAVLWQNVAPQQGAYQVQVRQLVSFSLDELRLVNEPGSGRRALLTGHFRPLQTGGTITSTPSTLRRPILVE